MLTWSFRNLRACAVLSHSATTSTPWLEPPTTSGAVRCVAIAVKVRNGAKESAATAVRRRVCQTRSVPSVPLDTLCSESERQAIAEIGP